uniref:Stress-associated endoplasmic reticulum protein n=1 Tax=Sinocyclocheilus grahami TaxID=75366 RepID=A0A672K9H5_SINGR
MSAVQRMKVANEKHSKTITQRGHVQKTTVRELQHEHTYTLHMLDASVLCFVGFCSL